MSHDTFLFVGLGNPGPKYENTRHNLGFWAVDRLAAALETPILQHAHKCLWAKTQYNGRLVLLAKPLTYMNLSGQAVQSIVRQFTLTPETIWVIYDDLDLPTGQLRLRLGGGAGGHRGVKSIIEALGHTDFGRIRIGIDRPPPHVDPADYVLSPIGKDEQAVLSAAADRAAAAALAIMDEGLPAAMNRFNQRISR